MLIFWVTVTCMLVVSLLVVLRPLLRRPPARSTDAATAKVNIYRNRLQEMEAEIHSGVLSGSDAEAARAELAHALLLETETDSSTNVDSNPIAQRHWWSAGITAVLVPVIAVFMYLRLGAPDFADGMFMAQGQNADDAAHLMSIDAMVKRLAERLEQQPDDPEGWMMLVNSYVTLGRFEEALKAIEHLYQITGDQPAVLVRYADVLATVNNGNLSGKPSELIQRALALDPENVIGLWLAGMAAAQEGDPVAAIEYWQRVLPLLEADQASQEEVRQMVAQARAQLGAGSDQAPAPVSPATAGADAVGGNLMIKISLSPDLAGESGAEQSLFVVARAINGPPMPLAVVRKTVADLPIEVNMNDTDAMMPSLKLSSFEQVEVSARISPSGNALPQPGDLVSASSLVRPGQGEAVTLVIDRKLP